MNTHSAGENSSDATKTKLNAQGNQETRWRWSAAVVLPFVLGLFYTEGRFYHEAYLGALGIDESLFPISTADAYWYALNGWASLIVKGVPAIWSGYPHYLWSNKWSFLLIVVVFLVLWLISRYSLLRSIRTPQAVREMVGLKSVGARAIFGMAGSILCLALIPFLMMFLLLLPAFLMAFGALPFGKLGQTDAQEVCQTAAALRPLVKYHVESMPDATRPARLFRCGESNCILVRDGEFFTIKKDAVEWTGGVSIPATRHKPSSEKVAPEDQLCAVPRTAQVLSSPSR